MTYKQNAQETESIFNPIHSQNSLETSRGGEGEGRGENATRYIASEKRCTTREQCDQKNYAFSSELRVIYFIIYPIIRSSDKVWRNHKKIRLENNFHFSEYDFLIFILNRSLILWSWIIVEFNLQYYTIMSDKFLQYRQVKVEKTFVFLFRKKHSKSTYY